MGDGQDLRDGSGQRGGWLSSSYRQHTRDLPSYPSSPPRHHFTPEFKKQRNGLPKNGELPLEITAREGPLKSPSTALSPDGGRALPKDVRHPSCEA